MMKTIPQKTTPIPIETCECGTEIIGPVCKACGLVHGNETVFHRVAGEMKRIDHPLYNAEIGSAILPCHALARSHLYMASEDRTAWRMRIIMLRLLGPLGYAHLVESAMCEFGRLHREHERRHGRINFRHVHLGLLAVHETLKSRGLLFIGMKQLCKTAWEQNIRCAYSRVSRMRAELCPETEIIRSWETLFSRFMTPFHLSDLRKRIIEAGTDPETYILRVKARLETSDMNFSGRVRGFVAAFMLDEAKRIVKTSAREIAEITGVHNSHIYHTMKLIT